MRSAGIIMPISSLPSAYGIGTLGAQARSFVDFLHDAGQTVWQVLPVGPTGFGDSPYQSCSSYAGNPYFIDFEDLTSWGYLTPDAYRGVNWGGDSGRVDYGMLYRERFAVLACAVSRLEVSEPERLERFCEQQAFWLDDYSLYMALKKHFGGLPWHKWPDEYRLHKAEALERARRELDEDVRLWKGIQFFFFAQWSRLHEYARERGVQILGDLPIYCAEDSADVWASPEQFQLDADLRPREVAGCPPDGFSATGQLWGNPLFDWTGMEADGYSWWIRRIDFQFGLYDMLRIDHFRGFDSYYAIPADAPDARAGRWRKGPGMKFFRALTKAIGPRKIVAEDLGFLTQSVHKLLADSGYPGMKVLQFAFDSRDGGGRGYQPHNYPHNCVAYVGTHDNDTALGWLAAADPGDVRLAREYLKLNEDEGEAWGMMRGVWASPADLAIVQMQDLLCLGSEARMNVPSTLGGNWCWRAAQGSFDHALAQKVRRQMSLYERLPQITGNVSKISDNGMESKAHSEGTPESSDRKEAQPMALQNQLDAELDILGVSGREPSRWELLFALTSAVRAIEGELVPAPGDRKLYYLSAEFLVGRLLRSNLINLGLLDEAKRILRSYGTTLEEIEDIEPEPSLGNGGLGRLAACFMDSIASLGLRGDGVGLNYHYGLFRQDLSSGNQRELPDVWIEPESWLEDTSIEFTVPFGDFDLKAKLYNIDVPGYRNGVANKLHLFDVEKPAPAPASGIDFDKGDIKHQMTSFLYPDDSDDAGRLLRVYQQYFLVSAGAQLIMRELEAAGHKASELDRYVAVQINDTHPSMVIPELIRLLEQRGIKFGDAVGIVERTCAYTNHTILAEALEKWPMGFIRRVAPQLVPIIRALDEIARSRGAEDSLAVVDADDVVHMAHMDVHFSSKVNGVAALHTQILEGTEMRGFYEMYPGKFTNKTNGVTFRRWLMGCNPALSRLATQTLGEGWKTNPDELRGLENRVGSDAFIRRIIDIKDGNKKAFSEWLEDKKGVRVNPDSIFDVQIKRLHQYKRQQMNMLYVIHKYLDIKGGNNPARPLTAIFSAKAAPAYTLAKDTIHTICCLSKLIAEDPEVAPWLQVVMIENYNVTVAEHLIPAADISEQISLASKEASGTGNMKLMANGALTLGTRDGANVEIAELVGEHNIYQFGATSEEVIDLYKSGGYDPEQYCAKPRVAPLVEFVVSPQMLAIGNEESLRRVRDDFHSSDYFMALLDLEDYIDRKEEMLADYEDRMEWGRRSLVNIARSGFFSSDRTIAEYNRDIWHLK